jgi:hypothetical protein
MTNRQQAFRFGFSCAAVVACVGASLISTLMGQALFGIMNGFLAGLNVYMAHLSFKEIKNVEEK